MSIIPSRWWNNVHQQPLKVEGKVPNSRPWFLWKGQRVELLGRLLIRCIINIHAGVFRTFRRQQPLSSRNVPKARKLHSRPEKRGGKCCYNSFVTWLNCFNQVRKEVSHFVIIIISAENRTLSLLLSPVHPAVMHRGTKGVFWKQRVRRDVISCGCGAPQSYIIYFHTCSARPYFGMVPISPKWTEGWNFIWGADENIVPHKLVGGCSLSWPAGTAT